MTLVVRRARVEEIRPLRAAVLRPGRPAEASVYPGEDNAVHVGAWAGDPPALVGCATVFPEPWPPPEHAADIAEADVPVPGPEPGAWRLRGMAVDASWQGGGVGRAVLAEAVAAATEARAPLLWANARTTALGFYERLGWQPLGAVFATGDTRLPHRVIVQLL